MAIDSWSNCRHCLVGWPLSFAEMEQMAVPTVCQALLTDYSYLCNRTCGAVHVYAILHDDSEIEYFLLIQWIVSRQQINNILFWLKPKNLFEKKNWKTMPIERGKNVKKNAAYLKPNLNTWFAQMKLISELFSSKHIWIWSTFKSPFQFFQLKGRKCCSTKRRMKNL